MAESVLLASVDNGAMSTVYGARVQHHGEFWDLARTAEQVAEIMRANDVPLSAKKPRVLAELHLAGYWPTRAALNNYMEMIKEGVLK